MTNGSAGKKTVLYISGARDIVGGGQRSFFLLLRNLDRERFRPVVLCPAPGEVSAEVSALGVETVFLEKPELRDPRVWRVPAYLLKLRAAAAAAGADLLHCDTLDTAFLAGLAFCGRPLVFHARVSDKGALLDKAVPFFCDRIACVSEAATRRFERVPGAAVKTRIVYNGVDTGEFGPGVSGAALRAACGIDPGAPVLAYCGQLVEEKGLRTLLEAFRTVAASLPGSRLLLAGRGPLEPELRRLAGEAGLADRVVFSGFIKNTPEFMAAADVFVLPSRMEGFSRVLLEAMASGKPVLATPAGGNAETVLDGVTGWFFPPGDAEALAAKALELLRDKGLAARMGAAGRARAEESFGIKRTAAELHRLYDELLPAAPPRTPGLPDREEMKAALKRVYLGLRGLALNALGLLLPRREVPRDGTLPGKILYIRVDRLGDMVLTTPAFRAIKEKFPKAELSVLAAPAAGALIAADPSVDRVILWTGGAGRRLRTVRELRREGFDIAVDPHKGYELRTALLAFLSGGRLRLGYASHGREVFFNVVSGLPGRVHFSAEAPYLLKKLGITFRRTEPELFVSGEAAAAAGKVFSEAGFPEGALVVAMHPGGVYESKRWAADRFAETAARLAKERGARFILIGNGEERELVERVAARLPAGEAPLKAVGLRPDVLCALIGKSRLFIGNNSGPLHMAAALGVPGVSTMGPADPVKWSPLGSGQLVLRAGLACSPCNRGVCRGHACMDQITVEMMLEAVQRLLAGRPGPAAGGV